MYSLHYIIPIVIFSVFIWKNKKYLSLKPEVFFKPPKRNEHFKILWIKPFWSNKKLLKQNKKLSFFDVLLKPIKKFPKEIQEKLILTRLMFWGLTIANFIDLDHIYYRLIGKIGWADTSCHKFFMECSSINFYPLHNTYLILVFFAFSTLIFSNNKKIKFIGWIGYGAVIHILLDCIQMILGFGI